MISVGLNMTNDFGKQTKGFITINIYIYNLIFVLNFGSSS